jgi:hypothetical protein
LHALVSQHAVLGPARAAPLLAANALALLLLLALPAEPVGLDSIGQQLARQVAVESLRAFLLALDGSSGRPVYQHHAGRHLVHVLPAFAAGADEAFVQVLFLDLQRGHTQTQGIRLVR